MLKRFAITVFGFYAATVPLPASASLERLADAYADVQTFGAWGKQRDTHNVEMERLKTRFEEERQLLINATEAREASARLENQYVVAMLAQYNGQQLLKVISLVEVLLAEMQAVIQERYKINADVRNFAEWFDKFTKGNGEEIDRLVALLDKTTGGSDEAIQKVLEVVRLGNTEKAKATEEARAYLKSAIEASNWKTLKAALSNAFTIKIILVELLEHNRQQLRSAIASMDADDAKRRAICKPDMISVVCKADGSECSYHDGGKQLPCNGRVFLNVFPVRMVKQIFDDLANYPPDAEFYVTIERIGSSKAPTINAYETTEAVFASELTLKPLLPARFGKSMACTRFETNRRRLMSAINDLNLYKGQEGMTPETRANVDRLVLAQPMIEFGIEGLALVVKPDKPCESLSIGTRNKLNTLVSATIAAERFLDALALGRTAISDDPAALKPIEDAATSL